MRILEKKFIQFGLIMNDEDRKRRYVIWCATMWVLWLARNQVVFHGILKETEGLLMHIKAVSWSWIICPKGEYAGYSFSDWKVDPMGCISMFH